MTKNKYEKLKKEAWQISEDRIDNIEIVLCKFPVFYIYCNDHDKEKSYLNWNGFERKIVWSLFKSIMEFQKNYTPDDKYEKYKKTIFFNDDHRLFKNFLKIGYTNKSFNNKGKNKKIRFL